MSEKTLTRGTHRLVPPEETWRRIEPTFAERGITRVADVTGLDDVGIPVCLAVRPDAHSLSVSQGKGLTLELARVSAAMEAIEVSHAEQAVPDLRAPASALPELGYRLTDLDLARPSLVSDRLPLDWTAARWLRSGRATWVPLDYVRISSLVGPGWTVPLFRSSSTGLAGGNSRDEAIVHALCEIIERDAVARSHDLPFDRRPWLDLGTVGDPGCRWLLERYRSGSNAVFVFDATHDLGVPCYEAHIWSPSLPVLFRGSGCHLDPAVALSRALTEAAQVRLATISGSREDLSARVYSLQADRAPRPPADPPGPRVPFCLSDDSTARLADDVALLTDRLARVRHVEPIVVDLPAEPVSVVKVVVQGMRNPLGAEETRPQREG
ncbi:ribosomal protein S12 methylthiotransferase accessory factor [Nonomuraea solani]|uniref:Ribosomal protein S12 methylthiotransferase accessory factor n=1 Tax=Nonomuraea solani TaxID=1144553 RepID=A0A1H6EQR9_9ACTN|nr:YcaO-like family protein [Nonomuraea solani]SEH00207.1 ribosomal protein S12 methylthiotransferase accessory factor [Nonomuraea solani]